MVYNVFMKKGYHLNIEKETIENNNFRRVLYTGVDMQLVLMALMPHEEIGMEVHQNDQFFRFEEGVGKCIINDIQYEVKDGDCIVVPAGVMHNIINTGTGMLKLYTLYAPPHHKDGTVHATKIEAEENEEEWTGETSE